jgi:hypothetical protein
MKLVSDIKVALKKGPLAHLIEEFTKYGFVIHRLAADSPWEGLSCYNLEIIYDNTDRFAACITGIRAMPEKFQVISEMNTLESRARGGLVRCAGGMPFETQTDFEINILGAAELINEKTAQGYGDDFCGIPSSVATVCAVRESGNVAKKLYPLYTYAERDSLILSRFSPFRGAPVAFQFNQLEDCVRILKNLSAGCRAMRLLSLEEADVFFYSNLIDGFPVPLIINELDEMPLYLLSLALKCAGNNRLSPEDTNIGIIGINNSVIRLTRLLLKYGFRRVLGCDASDRILLAFEGEGGMATTAENIFGNVDLIIVIRDSFEEKDYQGIRPGQFMIFMLHNSQFDRAFFAGYGIRDFIQGNRDDVSMLFPGMLRGMLNAGISSIDDMRLMELSRKVANLIAPDYTLPGIFSDIHSIVADLLDH